MNTYLTKIVFRVTSGKGMHTPQFDEQTRIIHAHNYQDAYSKARDIGYSNELCFINQKHEVVKWTFIDVSGIICLADYRDGDEICSHTIEPLDADLYISYLLEKSKAFSAGAGFTFEASNYN